MRLAKVERRWLDQVFSTILPDGAVPGMPGADRVPLDRFVRDLSIHAPPRLLLGLRLALFFVAVLAPLLVLGRIRTFSGLSDDERLRLLRELRTSRWYSIRELPVLLKSVACLGYCGLPVVQRRIGIEEPGPDPDWAREAAP
jgi:hypothetical protein